MDWKNLFPVSIAILFVSQDMQINSSLYFIKSDLIRYGR